MELALFLGQVFFISFSGAMYPGPVTATALTLGSRSKFAGAEIALGHAVIEFPLMILIMLGMDRILQISLVKTGIGVVGGILLMLMAYQMARSAKSDIGDKSGAIERKPIIAGLLLTASNPYFLLWWATIGLAMATKARSFGVAAFAMFTIAHWVTDLIWLSAISFASFAGSAIFGEKLQRIVFYICAAAMFVFGLKFIYDAAAVYVTG